MFDRFTDHAREVIVRAQEESRLLCHDHIGTEHLLLGVVAVPESPAVAVLGSLGLTPEAVRAAVLTALPPGRATRSGHIPFTPQAKKTLELSLRVALELHHDSVGAEHLLLGLVRTREGGAAQILDALGMEPAAARAAVASLEPPPASTPSASTPSAVAVDLHRLEAKVDALTQLVQSLLTRLDPP